MDSDLQTGINMQALKMSLLAGVATGIGSVGVYMFLQSNKEEVEEEDSTAREVEEQELKQKENKKFDEEDAAELDAIKKMLKDELNATDNTPEYQEDNAENPD